MPTKIPIEIRNQLTAAFRARVCEQMGVVPFEHQRRWWCASEGLELLDVEDPSGVQVRLPDNTITRRMIVPRAGGVARFISDLGAFKVGKSFGAALWATGFAIVPDARVSLIGLEYDICEPEFSYICDFLLSEAGMNMKHASLQNRPRDGKMYLDLPNGARFDARSWERKDTLKGKEIDAYLYCEAYQLPGIECFTGFSQNLRARRGFAIFPTTPDRPWVQELHNLGHGADPEWFCTCGVDASVNPFTYDEKARERDVKLMTREKFAIHYGGQLGDFVGRVFNYQRGQQVFTAGTHPELFTPGSHGQRDDLHLPDGWEIIGAVDTGTYYTALLVAFSPGGDAFVLDEIPNYRYVAGLPERDEQITIPEWSGRVLASAESLRSRSAFYADKNSQFKVELKRYGITLLPSTLPLETRTEIAREYFQHAKVWFAPWLSVLPFEIENACWPEESTAAGKFSRTKDRDHTLDCLEHILSRRPRGQYARKSVGSGKWIDSFVAANRDRSNVSSSHNPHLGAR